MEVSRVERVKELLVQKAVIEKELGEIRQQAKDELLAFKSGPKKERKKRAKKLDKYDPQNLINDKD